MMRARTMTMPITAATILFLCRVREASAKKSVLLWDVMVKVERATEVTTGGERSDTERVKPGQRGEEWRRERRERRARSAQCGATVTRLHAADRAQIGCGSSGRGRSPSGKKLPALFVRLQPTRAADVTSSGQSLLQFGLRAQQ